MRLRTAAAACTLAMLTPLALSGTAQTQSDRDCADFDSREEAQRTFDQQTGDPFNLDADDDGFVCEALPSEREGPPDTGAGDADEDDGTRAPDGAVDAGGGGAAGGPGDPASALAVAAGLGLAAGGTVLVHRRRRTSDPADAET